MNERLKRDWIPTITLIVTILFGLGTMMVRMESWLLSYGERLSVVETRVKDIEARLTAIGLLSGYARATLSKEEKDRESANR